MSQYCANVPRLGALPVAAVASSFLDLNSLLSKFGLSSSDPAKDRERMARIDSNFNAAMAGDPSAVACLRDMAQGVSSGPGDPRQCAVGSSVAAAYAKLRWAEYQARKLGGTVGAGLVLESPQATTAKRYLLWGGLGLAALFLLRR